uniref:inorganic diphosphatase n=1 Tax=Sexangularia sp. CB-2014 TaxID=1486929 RepID=A0A7S1VN85_9EUKA|mmetsp:Transcript_6818/g.21957  ORF Transcript_6818/g.21957 Transcript_6818/m.21957 type:complete len:257 (+) Transcript_6818:168-938(+)
MPPAPKRRRSDADTAPRGNGSEEDQERLLDAFRMLFRPNPWHGVPLGKGAPHELTAYIECAPDESIKFEMDKDTGFLSVDRPHKFSSVCPTLYGFLPQTYCADEVASLAAKHLPGIVGDGDPLDICVLSSRPVNHGDLLVKCRPVGGLRMIDGGEADDKIIAVLQGDMLLGEASDLKDIPESWLNLLRHYFLSYKMRPDDDTSRAPATVTIPEVYGVEEAHRVIAAAQADYQAKFSGVKQVFVDAIRSIAQAPTDE